MELEQRHPELIDVLKTMLTSRGQIILEQENIPINIKVHNDKIIFDLPSLHLISQQINAQFKGLSYTDFRKLLYHFPTNQMIQELGGCFDIDTNLGNIDKNCYCLKFNYY